MPCAGDVAMRGTAGANSVSGPECGAIVVESDVAFPLEGGLARCLPDEKALTDKPAAEVGSFSAALGWVEAGDGGYAVMNQGAVTKEDHVGTAGFGMEQTHIGDAAEDVVHALPLSKSEIARGAVYVACHPGIEDVIDTEPLRGTHEKGGTGKLRRGGEDVGCRE
jgi:hypothetical protein